MLQIVFFSQDRFSGNCCYPGRSSERSKACRGRVAKAMSSAGSRPARIEVRVFDQDARAFGVAGLVGDRHHVADGRQVDLVHGLVGLGLTQDPDVLVMLEDGVPGIDDSSNARPGVLGLADVRTLAGQPQNVVLAADLPSDIDAPPGPIEGILPVGGTIRRERPVDCPRILPEPGGDDLDEESLTVEDLLDVGHASLRTRL